jgi:hypothetical protein
MKTIIGIIIFAAFVIAIRCHYLYYEEYPKINEIKSNMQLTTGTIIKENLRTNRGGREIYLTYQYSIGDTTLYGETSFDEDHLKEIKDLEHSKFPVVYSSKHFNLCDILLTEDDSEKYGFKWGQAPEGTKQTPRPQ